MFYCTVYSTFNIPSPALFNNPTPNIIHIPVNTQFPINIHIPTNIHAPINNLHSYINMNIHIPSIYSYYSTSIPKISFAV